MSQAQGNYLYLGGTGNESNTMNSAMILSDSLGVQFGAGTDSADSLASEWMRIAKNGSVGIGSTNPASKLSVVSTSSDASIFTVGIDAGWANNRPRAVLGTLGWNGVLRLYDSGDNESLRLTVNGNSYLNGGNIGIGTTTPKEKLEVNGGLRFTRDPSGTVQTTAWTGVLCGGDYAESVDVTGERKKYEPGDVLVLDLEHSGSFVKSAEPYSTSVAGIYSTKPGVVGRRSTDATKQPDEVPMAMVGIVPTKVSAENGPISTGDLLVTSATAGYAMKGTDRSRMLGAVVGKAMGRLDEGTGIIEVLVTLQ
jgi:hypothetical protein